MDAVFSLYPCTLLLQPQRREIPNSEIPNSKILRCLLYLNWNLKFEILDFMNLNIQS